MKTLDLLSKSLLLIIIVLLTSCKPKTAITETGDFCTTYDGKPEQTITYKEMAIMLKQYRDTRKPILKNALGFEDTHTNWVQIDSLKKYLAYIQKLSEESGVEITGINILSAAYPNESIYGIERNYQTLILNPTTLKDGDPTVSFDPLYSENGVPMYVNDLLMPYFNELDSLLNTTTNKRDLKKYIINMNLAEGVQDQPSSAMNRMIGTPPN